MRRAAVAIIDAAHARLYIYDHLDDEPPRMRELRDLVNPGRQAHGMFGEPMHRRAHGTVDDHRSAHLQELEARFAKIVIGELDRLAQEHGLARAIIVASPRMLGAVRDEYAPLERQGLEIIEIAQDLAWLTSPQLHDHLAAMRLIDPRPRAQLARDRRSR